MNKFNLNIKNTLVDLFNKINHKIKTFINNFSFKYLKELIDKSILNFANSLNHIEEEIVKKGKK